MIKFSPPQKSLKRECLHYRDDRKIFIACDDTYAPKQYFEHVELPRVGLILIETPKAKTDSYITYVLDRLINAAKDFVEERDELWLVLDTDHCIKGSHLKSFTEGLCRARQCRVNVAFSRPCFEFWLALYHADASRLVDCTNAKAICQRLDVLVGDFRGNKTGYDKGNVQDYDYPDTLLPIAYARAKNRDGEVTGGDIPQEQTTRVYKIWESLMRTLRRDLVPERYLGIFDTIFGGRELPPMPMQQHAVGATAAPH